MDCYHRNDLSLVLPQLLLLAQVLHPPKHPALNNQLPSILVSLKTTILHQTRD